MRNLKYLCLVSILFIYCNEAMSQDNKKKWDYPVKPGSTQWAEFTTSQQMLDACQIPQEILSTLSTQDLVEICMNYPLYLDYTASNDERAAIRFMIEKFNGLKELSQRADAARELMAVYAKYPVTPKDKERRTKEDCVMPFKLSFLELILSTKEFVEKLNSQELVDLQKSVSDKYVAKLGCLDVYSVYNIKKTLLLGAVVLQKQGVKAVGAEQLEVVDKFIKNYNQVDPNILTETSKIISEL